MNDTFTIVFSEQGLEGIDVQPHADPEILAQRYEFLRRLRPAIKMLQESIRTKVDEQ